MQPEPALALPSAAGPSVADGSGPFGKPCDVVLADGEFVAAVDAGVSVHANALSYGRSAPALPAK